MSCELYLLWTEVPELQSAVPKEWNLILEPLLVD